MRHSALALVLVIAGGSAWAEGEDKPSPLLSEDLLVRQTACKGVGSIAATIMKQRQKEVPMSEMVSRLLAVQGMGLYDGTGLTADLVVGLIKAAYRQPAFSQPELQENIVAAFRNEIELPCFDGKLITSP